MSQEDKLRLFKNTKSWKELPQALLEELAEVMTVEEVRVNRDTVAPNLRLGLSATHSL
jgi:hypothetical protein